MHTMKPALGARTIFAIAAVAIACAVSLGAQTDHQWIGADGEPLPFADDTALIEFMSTADVVEEKNIGTGVNRSVRLTLEKNGVRAHAIFREVDRRERILSIEGVTYQRFADSYLFECAAYELARMIGMGYIPPATLRDIRGRKGSLQIWLEDALDELGAGFQPPSPLAWSEQVSDMYFFDNLIYNIDRNPGNMLVTPDFRLWMIDHTRGFQFKDGLLNDRILRVRRSSYEKLMALSEDEIRDAMRPFLNPTEMGSLIKRRSALKQHVDALIAQSGEASIFY